MKFIDEAKITIEAGNGGNGIVSFRREKYIERGGPNGGDGGDGASVYLIANQSITTLVDFTYTKKFKAPNGENGQSTNCTGAKGEDLYISVPIGTKVIAYKTQEFLGDLTKDKETLLVAKGGFHGLGNTRFKSSINQAPRKATKGSLGDVIELKLELSLLADVGLLGLPNAGKSTFIRKVSSAKPKVADYPFTTLKPHLGVVRLDYDKTFVIADIPGIIKGAAVGQGLGLRFLKHLSRCKILLHIIDITLDDYVKNIQTIKNEIISYGKDVSEKPIWIVLNKVDLICEEEKNLKIEQIKKELKVDNLDFISAINGQNTRDLLFKIFNFLKINDN